LFVKGLWSAAVSVVRKCFFLIEKHAATGRFITKRLRNRVNLQSCRH